MENNKNNCSSIDETLSLIMVESSGDYYELYNADVNILAAVLAGADIGHLFVNRSFIDFVGVTCNGDTISAAGVGKGPTSIIVKSESTVSYFELVYLLVTKTKSLDERSLKNKRETRIKSLMDEDRISAK